MSELQKAIFSQVEELLLAGAPVEEVGKLFDQLYREKIAS